jgi:hypothetical protein
MAAQQPQDRVDFPLFDRRVSNYQKLGRDGSSIATLQRGAASSLRLVTQLKSAGAAPTLQKRAALEGFHPESISTRLVHAYIVFAAFSDDDIKKAWAALREQHPVAFPTFFHVASHPKRTPWASFNRAPSPSQFIPATGPYHSFQTPHASYPPPPPLLLGGPGGPPPRQITQNICFKCGDYGHKSNSCNKPQTTDPERLAYIAAARQRVAAHVAKRKATPASGASSAKRNRN